MSSPYLSAVRKAQILAGLTQAGVPRAEAEEVVATYEEVKRINSSPPPLPPRPARLGSSSSQSSDESDRLLEPNLAGFVQPIQDSSTLPSEHVSSSSTSLVSNPSLPSATNKPSFEPQISITTPESSEIKILLVDSYEHRFQIAQAYLELLRVLNASTTGTWLFGSVSVAYFNDKSRPPNRKIHNLKVQWLRLPRWSELPSNEAPFEKAHIRRSMYRDSPKRFNMMPTPAELFEFDYILAWKPAYVASLKRSLENLTTTKAKPRIRLLPQPQTRSEKLYIASICEGLERFLLDEIDWKAVKESDGVGKRWRTMFLIIKARKKNVRVKLGDDLFHSKLEAQYGCRLFDSGHARKKNELAAALVAPMETLNDAEEALDQQLRMKPHPLFTAEWNWHEGELAGDWESEKIGSRIDEYSQDTRNDLREKHRRVGEARGNRLWDVVRSGLSDRVHK